MWKTKKRKKRIENKSVGNSNCISLKGRCRKIDDWTIFSVERRSERKRNNGNYCWSHKNHSVIFYYDLFHRPQSIHRLYMRQCACRMVQVVRIVGMMCELNGFFLWLNGFVTFARWKFEIADMRRENRKVASKQEFKSTTYDYFSIKPFASSSRKMLASGIHFPNLRLFTNLTTTYFVYRVYLGFG